MPVDASSIGSAAVRMITRMVCTTAMPGDVGALLGGRDRDLRQRAGAAGQKAPRSGPSRGRAADKSCCRRSSRRSRAPAARWSADRRRHAAAVAATPASPAKSRAAPARSGSGSAARRAAARRSRRSPTAIMAPEISPPGRFAHRNSSAAGGADGQRFEHIEDFGAAGKGTAWMRGFGSRRLMANPASCGTNAPARCSNALRLPAGGRGQGDEGRRLLGSQVASALRRALPVFLHSDRISCAPCRAGPWRRPPWSIRARRRCAASRPSFPRAPLAVRLGVGLGAGAAVCAKAEPISSSDAKAVAATREEIVIMEHLGLKRRATSRRDAEPPMNEARRTCAGDHYILAAGPLPLSRAAAALG